MSKPAIVSPQQTTDNAARLRSLLDDDELPELRPFPQVASQLLTLCDDPDVSPKDIAHVIECDPAMASGVLRVANSSLYGFSGQVRTIDRAIVALGFRATKSLAVSVAAESVFESQDSVTSKQCKRLWLHSLATGAIASLVAPHAKLNADEAFLAGVVHDVGKLFFVDLVGSEYTSTVSDLDTADRTLGEEREFGVNHQQLGERCADEWGLPSEINPAIAMHHEPENTGDGEELAGVVCIANSFARYLKLGGAEGSQEALATAVERSELGIPLSIFDDEFSEQAREVFEGLRTAYA